MILSAVGASIVATGTRFSEGVGGGFDGGIGVGGSVGGTITVPDFVARHCFVVPPAPPLQDQRYEFPLCVTELGVPALQRFERGAVVKLPPLELPQIPSMLIAPLIAFVVRLIGREKSHLPF